VFAASKLIIQRLLKAARFRREELMALLRAGTIEMFFDGLDEIFEAEKRSEAIELIVQTRERLSQHSYPRDFSRRWLREESRVARRRLCALVPRRF